MHITPALCRAARGLLGWSQDELRVRAKMSRKTIADFELGLRSPFERTLDDLQRTFEAAGVVFFEPVEGIHDGTVGMRWGVDPLKPDSHLDNNSRPEQGKSAKDALGWGSTHDIDICDYHSEIHTSADWDDHVKEAQIAHWRSRPEQWAALAEVSRQCLLRAMGVNQLWGE